MEAERGRRLDRAFAEVAVELDPRERAFAHELAFGVTRLRGRLDHLLAHHVHRGLDDLDPTVHELLRLGAYQLLYMGGVPDYAAVSETVEQVRTLVHDRPAGFANAVLRKVKGRGDGPDTFPEPSADPATFLETWGSHPRWLVDRWLARWDVADTRALVEAGNRRPMTYLVPLEMTPEDAVERLVEADMEARVVGLGTACVLLGGGVSPAAALSAIPEAVIQDPGANLVAAFADIPSGTKVADLCAAPGGKVLATADGQTYTLASDRSESRIHMVRENARRAGRRMGYVVADARRPAIREADVVLLDVPCTGTGTLSRHPDARWRLQPESITQMAALQREMLSSAADVVAPGGLLLYSTCSLEPEENEDVVYRFLADRSDFVVESTRSVPAAHVGPEGFLFVTPQETGFDGAFAARMRKAG